MKYTGAIVTGSMSWDIIMDFPNRFVNFLQPDKLHQINVSFVVDNLEKQMGGTATNISYAIAEALKVLGVKRKVTILGALGKDGKAHLDFFRKNGIETAGILFDKKRYSASGTVITDLSDNQIWGFYYGACSKGKDADFKKHACKDNIMIISANHPDAFLAAERYAITNKVPYIYDVGMAMSWIKLDDLRRGVMNAKYLVGNDYEIALITKTLKTDIKELNAKGINVITTLGEEGVTINFATDSAQPLPLWQSLYVPAYKLKKTIDPTGAGDAWRGGFMAGLLAERPIEECLRLGNVTASFAVEKYGTVNYRMSKTEFIKRLKTITISNPSK